MLNARVSKHLFGLFALFIAPLLLPQKAEASYICYTESLYSHAPGAPREEWDLVERVRICAFLGSGGSPVHQTSDGSGWDSLPWNQTAGKVSTRIEDEQKTSCDATDRPVVIANGQKILSELDFVTSVDAQFGLARVYDSGLSLAGAFGPNWASNIDYGLVFEHGATQCAAMLSASTACSTSPTGLTKIFVRRPGGGRVSLTLVDGIWKAGAGDYELSQEGGNWVLWTQQGDIETYNAGGQPISTRDEGNTGLNFIYDGTGKLTQVAHTSGRSMTLTWTNNKITNVLGPDAKNYTFAYSSQGYLQSATLPDGLGQRTYHYEVTGKPRLLTGVSVAGVRKTRYSYYSDGRVQQSGDEDGGHVSSFVYAAGSTSVTNALGQTKTYLISDDGLISQINRPASATCAAGVQTSQYDDMGRLTLEVDGSGNRTRYTWGPPAAEVGGRSIHGRHQRTAGHRLRMERSPDTHRCDSRVRG